MTPCVYAVNFSLMQEAHPKCQTNLAHRLSLIFVHERRILM